MKPKHKGMQTVLFQNPPSIISSACIAGKKEGQGPLAKYFDDILEDDLYGEKTWEKAETKLIRETLSKVLNKAGKTQNMIDYIFCGDLLNQCIATNFAMREIDIPFFGLYGACSTMCEGMSLGAMLVDGGFAENTVAITSSHFCASERQYRYPLEMGTQRPPTAQRTVTGSGGVLISDTGTGPYITQVTTGKVIDLGIKDTNDMGAAMAPAAVDCILAHFQDTNDDINTYDLIITGDLGHLGLNIANDLLTKSGMNLGNKLQDCGAIIFDSQKQDTHSGGSGCGCSAVTFAGYLYKELTSGNLNKIMLVATGALMNPLTAFQGESIPAIAHAVTIQNKL